MDQQPRRRAGTLHRRSLAAPACAPRTRPRAPRSLPRFNHGPNQWPADLPGWRETMATYFTRMIDLIPVPETPPA
jgi:isopenicillin N synthase-like dioxygenase